MVSLHVSPTFVPHAIFSVELLPGGVKRNVKYTAPRLQHFLVAKQPWEVANSTGWRGVLNYAF